MTQLILIFFSLALAALLGFLWRGRLRGDRTGRSTEVVSSIQSLRDIGQLSVFKVVTKEIVTAEDHSWGQVGRKYLQWLMSNRKMALIFEFEIDFRYDLRSAHFRIEEAGPQRFVFHMPPCTYDVSIRDMKIYDERKSRFLPLLLPDLLNDFLGGTFSESDKNQLIADARRHAERQARVMIGNLSSEVQSSARGTLNSISRAFHAEKVDFVFEDSGTRDLTVQVSEAVSNPAG